MVLSAETRFGVPFQASDLDGLKKGSRDIPAIAKKLALLSFNVRRALGPRGRRGEPRKVKRRLCNACCGLPKAKVVRDGSVRTRCVTPLGPGLKERPSVKFHGGDVAGARVLEMDRRGDERGFFGRLFCEQEFANAGLEHRFVQVNNSLTGRRGTLRGMHYQLPPAAEVKVVRCIRGAIYDVVADLRPDSPTYGRWLGAELNEENRHMMYVPRGCAHGFLTLTDDAEALYLVSAAYAPEQERGLRFDDPWVGIRWPIDPLELSAKDQAWPAFDPEFHGVEQMRGLPGTTERVA